MKWSLAMSNISQTIDDDEKMHLHCGPFWWPWGSVGAMPCALLVATGSGLHTWCHWTMPLGECSLHIAPSATMATLLLAILLAIVMHRYQMRAGIRYRTHRPMKEVRDFTRSHWTPQSGKYSLKWKQLYTQMVFFHRKLVEKGLELVFRPLLAIGVWQFKLMGST